MAGVGTLISSLLSKAAKLLPKVKNSFFVLSSSSSSQSPNPSVVEDDLNKLIMTLKRIKATLYDAEEREIRDESVKLWLKELKEVGHDAEYVIDEYMYEVYRAQVEARNAFEFNTHKRKREEGSVGVSCAHSIRVPDGFVDRIGEIRNRFDEIAKDRETLRLHEGDGPRIDKGVKLRAPSCHLMLEPNVFGRENDKERVIELLFSNISEGVFTVVPIVGKGGLGKTTLAKLLYNDKRIKEKFDLFGWVCVSEDFNAERILQELIECFTRYNCSIKNMSILQEKIMEMIKGKKIFVVLDDVWNEDKNFWELIHAPFNAALRAVFIVTIRSDRVAKIMQTTPPFWLGCLSEEESWSLFQHYAFGKIDHSVHPNLLNLGGQITKKCGGLPLAVKSISNLLRYEDEKSWIEILENDLWEIFAESDIFGALQISYTRMPTYLRPCFLYCFLFPKNYVYRVDELIELWINAGYIGSKGKRNLEDIALEYVLELRERSFFDPSYGIYRKEIEDNFKIHDIVHDLARLNSGNEFYSIERGKHTNIPGEAIHIYLDTSRESWNHLTLNNITRLRTLILEVKSGCDYTDLSKAKKLTTLKLHANSSWYKVRLPHIVFPKHLRLLELACAIRGSLEVPFSSLYSLESLNLNLRSSQIVLNGLENLINLQSLSISNCIVEGHLDTIGYLVRLRKLVFLNCLRLRLLPESLCKLSDLQTMSLIGCLDIRKLPDNIANLTNLQTLIIRSTGINYLPHGFNKLNFLRSIFKISLRWDGVSDSISWLKNCDNLKGTVAITQLKHMDNIETVRNFNLVSKSYMEKLILSWDETEVDFWREKHILALEINENYEQKTSHTRELQGDGMDLREKRILSIEINENYEQKTELQVDGMDLRVLESLRPHSNLKHLRVHYYRNPIFPQWIGDPLSCASLEELHLNNCTRITYLPFGNLRSLMDLRIRGCYNLQTISQESLPSQLQKLIIWGCDKLLAITGLEELESLVEVEVDVCNKLNSFPFEIISKEHCHKSCSSGLRNNSPLKKLKLHWCDELRLAVNEVIPSTHCNIDISVCKGLKEWCLQHNIIYQEW